MSRFARKHRLPDRRLHLLDVENLIGCARPAAAEVASCAASYVQAVGATPDDQAVLACNHGAASAVAFGWPQTRLLQRSGRDGADLALLEVIATERVAERFTEVVIGSGDGIFVESVAHLASHGLDVTVVARRSSLSRALRLAVVPWDVVDIR